MEQYFDLSRYRHLVPELFELQCIWRRMPFDGFVVHNGSLLRLPLLRLWKRQIHPARDRILLARRSQFHNSFCERPLGERLFPALGQFPCLVARFIIELRCKLHGLLRHRTGFGVYLLPHVREHPLRISLDWQLFRDNRRLQRSQFARCRFEAFEFL